jgi:uncharacterized protein YdgA (DUF945 family)
MAFFGGGTTTLSGEGHSVPLSKLGIAQADDSIAWDAFKMSIGMSGKARSYEIDGRQPRIEITSHDGKEHLLFSNLTLAGKGSRVTEDLYDGKVGFGIGKFAFAGAGSPAIDVSNIRYEVDSQNKGDYFDYAVRMGSGEVKTAALDQYKMQLKEVHYDMTLRHLHTPTLQKLSRALRDSSTGMFDSPVGAPKGLFAPLAEHGIALLKHDPEFSIDRIGIVTAQGEAVLKGVIKLPGITDKDLEGGAMSLVPKLVADITFEAPQALFENVPNGNMVMGVGIDQGYLKREGGKITSRVQFRNDALTINGKSLSIPPALGGQAPTGPPPALELPQPPAGG